MFEAYKVSVVMVLDNKISPVLSMMAKDLEKLDGLTTLFRESLAKVSTEAAGLKGLSSAISSTNRAFERAAFSAAAFHRELAAIRATGGSMPRLPGGGGGGGGSGGGLGRRGPGGVHGGNIHLGPGGIGLGTGGMATGDWFWPLAASAGAVYAGSSLFEAAKGLDTERQRFGLLGLTDAQNADAFRYVDGMRIYGSTRTENMRNFREAQGVFRESGLSGSAALEGAKLAAPVLSKLNFLAESLGGEEGAKLASANLAMLRYVELSGGLKSASEFNRIANFGWKLNQSSGGTVDWQQLLAFKKTAGSAGYNLTDEALARLEPIMAELVGGRAGTADATAYNRIMGITRVPNQVAHALVDYGLWDKSKIAWNSQGGIKNMLGNPLSQENSDLFHQNPERFYEEVIRPIYAKMKLDSDGITRENALIFGRTGGQFFNAIERAMPQIKLAIEAVNKAKGIEDSMNAARNSLSGQEKEFTAAWKDFKTDFGTSMLPFFTGILKAGDTILRALPRDTGKHLLDNAGMAGFGPFGQAVNFINDIFKFGSPGSSVNVAGKGGSALHPSVTPVNLYIDGKKVASTISPWLANPLAGDQTGVSGGDPTQMRMITGGLQ